MGTSSGATCSWPDCDELATCATGGRWRCGVHEELYLRNVRLRGSTASDEPASEVSSAPTPDEGETGSDSDRLTARWMAWTEEMQKKMAEQRRTTAEEMQKKNVRLRGSPASDEPASNSSMEDQQLDFRPLVILLCFVGPLPFMPQHMRGGWLLAMGLLVLIVFCAVSNVAEGGVGFSIEVTPPPRARNLDPEPTSKSHPPGAGHRGPSRLHRMPTSRIARAGNATCRAARTPARSDFTGITGTAVATSTQSQGNSAVGAV